MRSRQQNKGLRRRAKWRRSEDRPTRCGASATIAKGTETRPVSRSGVVALRIAGNDGYAQDDGKWGARETARTFTCHAAILAYAVQNGFRDFVTVATSMRFA